MSKLFSPITLRGETFNNRIAVSPMCQYACEAEDGVMGDWHLMNLGQYAIGAAGLIFTEATGVSAQGRISKRCTGLWNDEQEASMKRVVDFCHKYGVAKVGIQLGHAGRKASTRPPGEGGTPLTAEEGAWQTVAPSAIPYAPDWHVPQQLDRAGLEQVKQEFVDATVRAARAGFDVVEMHGGHGYLLSQFFSPLSNQRTDEYGGSVENRIKFPLEIYEAMRAVWPEDKPLGIRISAVDWVEGGSTVEDTIVYAKALQDLGCDFIDITTAGVDHRQKITVGKAYQVPMAAAVKAAIDIPVMAVGMLNDPHLAESVIDEGKADFVMLARGAMYNPRWAWHAAFELGDETDYPKQFARCKPQAWPEAFGLTREPRVTTDQRS